MNDQNVTERFNGDYKKRDSAKNYSHWKLMDKIALYERQTKTKEDREKLIEIKNEYEKKEQKKPMLRAQRNSYFKDGIYKGLHQDKDYSDLIEQDKVIDQMDRNKTHEKVKSHYHKNFSLYLKFKRENEKSKTLNKE